MKFVDVDWRRIKLKMGILKSEESFINLKEYESAPISSLTY